MAKQSKPKQKRTRVISRTRQKRIRDINVMLDFNLSGATQT
jgi:hypothetical protein